MNIYLYFMFGSRKRINEISNKENWRYNKFINVNLSQFVLKKTI